MMATLKDVEKEGAQMNWTPRNKHSSQRSRRDRKAEVVAQAGEDRSHNGGMPVRGYLERPPGWFL